MSDKPAIHHCDARPVLHNDLTAWVQLFVVYMDGTEVLVKEEQVGQADDFASRIHEAANEAIADMYMARFLVDHQHQDPAEALQAVRQYRQEFRFN